MNNRHPYKFLSSKPQGMRNRKTLRMKVKIIKHQCLYNVGKNICKDITSSQLYVLNWWSNRRFPIIRIYISLSGNPSVVLRRYFADCWDFEMHLDKAISIYDCTHSLPPTFRW